MTYSFLSNSFSDDNGFGALVVAGRKAELVHHPVSLGPFSGASPVIHKGLLQPNTFSGPGRVYGFVNSGCFPETRTRHSIRSYAVSVFSSSFAEEIPLFIPYITRFYNSNKKKKKKIYHNYKYIYIYI